MKTRSIANLMFALFVAFAAACVSDPPGTGVTPADDCQSGSTDPECEDAGYCEDNPDAAVCQTDDAGYCEDNPDAAVCQTDDAEPCDGACTADEICHEMTDTCVACLNDEDCETGVCVDGASPADNACAECADSSDCDEPDAARCVTGETPADNACRGCDDSGQCAGFLGLEACDVDSGECVECVTDSDCEMGGTTYVCDLRDNTCSDIEVGSAGGCEPCVGNSSCRTGNFCVELAYQGTPRGYYCMPRFDPEVAECPPAYGAAPDDRQTLGGGVESVCVVKELLTTCEAIEEFETSCPSGSECTADGSSCESFGGIPRCTYECTSEVDCLNGVTCGGNDAMTYCGLGSEGD